MYQVAEEARQAKEAFVANVSHELRTPLNSLLILARMLSDNKDGNLTEEQIESSQIIYSGGTDLLNLINDILDLSKIEEGKMDLYLERFEIPTMIEEVATTVSAVVENA